MPKIISFTARVIAGEGRGKDLGSPTLNLDLRDVPGELKEGVYAVRSTIEGKSYPATMHFGHRPTLKLQASCEVHLLDTIIGNVSEVSISIIERLRDVRDFGNEEGLKKQIAEDIERARKILLS